MWIRCRGRHRGSNSACSTVDPNIAGHTGFLTMDEARQLESISQGCRNCSSRTQRMTRHKGKLSAIDWPRVAGQRGFRYVGMMLSRKDAARGARQDRWRLRKRRSRVKGLSDETGLINLRRSPSTESGPAPPKHSAISPAR